MLYGAPTGAFYKVSTTVFESNSVVNTGGLGFDSSRVVRTSSETRGPSVAVAPVILI